jgi:hypothetical protein
MSSLFVIEWLRIGVDNDLETKKGVEALAGAANSG